MKLQRQIKRQTSKAYIHQIVDDHDITYRIGHLESIMSTMTKFDHTHTRLQQLINDHPIHNEMSKLIQEVRALRQIIAELTTVDC